MNEFDYAKNDSSFPAYGGYKAYNVYYHFPPYKPLQIQTIVTQHLHMLQGECHVLRNQPWLLCNSEDICL